MRWLVAGAAVLLVSVGSAYAEPPEHRPPPPPLRHEVAPPRPRPEAVWVHGHWVWSHGHYVWVAGHYR